MDIFDLTMDDEKILLHLNKMVMIDRSTSSLSTSKEDEYVRFNMGSSLNDIDEVVPELRNRFRRSQEQRFFL
jgi:hypothetical protein